MSTINNSKKRKRSLKDQQKPNDSDNTLEETEVVFIKYEDSDEEDEYHLEDILEEKKPEVS